MKGKLDGSDRERLENVAIAARLSGLWAAGLSPSKKNF